MKNLKKHGLTRRLTAAVLCVCMVLSLCQGLRLLTPAAKAAEAPTGTVDVIRQADPSTMDTYKEMLDFSESTRYAGRLWSDKTVFALGYRQNDVNDQDSDWVQSGGVYNTLKLNLADDGVERDIVLDEDFLHVYSVLGSSEQNNTQTTIPLDLVMVLDVSGSMGNADLADSKIHQSVKAMNDAIDRLMRLNPNNRVGVVLFASYSQVLMPLAHYDPIESPRSDAVGPDTQNYIRITESYNYSNQDGNPSVSSNSDYYLYGFQAIQTDGTHYGYNGNADSTLYTGASYHVGDDGNGTGNFIGSNTNIDSGMWRGLNMLLNSDHTTTEINGKTYSVIPTFVFLGDGDPQLMMQTTTSGNWWAPNVNSMAISSTGVFDDPPIILNTVMRAALMKAAVIKHYRDAARAVNASNLTSVDLAFNTVGISLGQVGHTGYGTETATALLNPGAAVNGFNGSNAAVRNTNRYVVREAYNAWATWQNGNGTVNLPSIIGDSGTYNTYFNQVPNNLPLGDVTVTKQDVINNIYYTDTFFDAGTAGDIANAFQNIVDSVIGNTFAPVEGQNDLGVGNSVTFMDPMGKYMDVKDVKGVSLFGNFYPIVKTAVYDFQWNDAYMAAMEAAHPDDPTYKRGEAPMPQGWYRGEATEAEYAGVDEANNPKLPADCANSQAAWAAGWVFRVNYQTAAQFVPTLEKVYSDPDNLLTKEKQTEYTFYRLNIAEGERTALHMNPAYGSIVPEDAKYDGINQDHLDFPGVFALADMRIWVEDTGDYSDDLGGVETDSNYDEALWVNIPVNMLPLRKVTINEDTSGNYTYQTNIPTASQLADMRPYSDLSASFPLRVYYTVGVSDDVLGDDNRINMADIGVEYTTQNKAATTEAANARKIPQGAVEFFSNWYNPLNRYSAYATTSADYTFGDPVTSFSPAAGNRYYTFQKALPLYSHAYIWDEGNSQWRRVSIGEDLTEEELKDVRTFDATDFGGRLLAQDLKISGDITSDLDNNTELINTALEALEGLPDKKDKDIVLLHDDILTNVDKPAGDVDDPFGSDDYFFLAIEFYNLEEGNKAELTQYVITRKSTEFGSAYKATGIENGSMLVWHDVSGKNTKDYPYMSADTGDLTRGRDYIGKKDIYEADGQTLKEPSLCTRDDDFQEGGTWVLCAKPGGLRVGGLSQAVRQKSGTYSNADEQAKIKDYYDKRYTDPEWKDLTWGFYSNNVTRTANNYYLPTISTGSTTADVRVNTYLGNNGRLYVMDTTLMVSKLVEDPNSYELLDNGEQFNYQVFIDGVTGPQSAIVVKYNGEDGKNGSWQRQLHFIDMQLDTQLFLQTSDGQKAMVDSGGRRVISNPNGEGYVYADNTSNIYAAGDGGPYYVFIGKNEGTSEIGATDKTFRAYHNNEVDGNGSVDGVDVTYESTGGAGKISATTVWLVSQDTYNEQWPGVDTVGTDFNIRENKSLYTTVAEGTTGEIMEDVRSEVRFQNHKGPWTPDDDEPWEELEDPEVPLDQLPKTGDETHIGSRIIVPKEDFILWIRQKVSEKK